MNVDGPELEPRRGRDLPWLFRPAPRPTQPPVVQWYRVFPGRKLSVRGVNHPPPSSAEVKERVKLYLCFPSASSLSVIGRTVLLPLMWGSRWCEVVAVVWGSRWCEVMAVVWM